MGVQQQDWEKTYRLDFYEKGGEVLRKDLLELDNLRSQYDQQRQSEYAAFQQDNSKYSSALTKAVNSPGHNEGGFTETVVTGYEFTGSKELRNLESRINALAYYDERMPEAGRTRQARRELEETGARIAQRKADEAARRDELRRLRLAPQNVNTTQQGVLGG